MSAIAETKFTETEPAQATRRRTIGPLGFAARLVVGTGFIAIAMLWRDPTWTDPVVGLVALPAVEVALLGWRARRNPAPLDATTPTAHCLNVALFLPLAFVPATAGGTFLFYGVSMLVAAARRAGGCEVTAITNTILGRDDQVGCVLFGPIDTAEARPQTAVAVRS